MVRSGQQKRGRVVERALQDRFGMRGPQGECRYEAIRTESTVVSCVLVCILAFATIVLSACTPAAAVDVAVPTPLPRVPNGTILQDYRSEEGLGKLTVENGLNLDAVVALAGLDDTPVVAFYVQAWNSHTVEGIPDGVYRLYFSTGENWDVNQGLFTRPSVSSLFRDTLTFQTTRLSDRTQFSIIDVTLHSAPDGRAPVDSISPERFPPIR